jgi:hypothetical protein
MHISGPVENTRIDNNIFIIPEKPSDHIDQTIIEMDIWSGPWPKDTWLANNIFYVENRSHPSFL